MKNLSSRIEAAETALNRQTGADLPGVVEVHFTNTWPHCLSDDRQPWEQCFDHEPGCAKIVSRNRESGLIVLLRDGYAGI